MFDFIFSIISTVLSSSSLILMKEFFDRKQTRQESKEIQEDAEKIIGDTFKSNDIIELMLKNVRELREYYVISKRQATNAFSASLLVCFLGFVIYITGIIAFVSSGENALLLTTIAGTIVEVISGLFFWLYRQTLAQLNIYHQRLGTTEKYLTAIRLADKMGEDKHDNTYWHIICCILQDAKINQEKVVEGK